MFSGQGRSLLRRIVCKNLLEAPRVSQNALAADIGRDHHNHPGGSDQRWDKEKETPKWNGCCPFLLTRNAFEYIGVASFCFIVGNDIRRDVSSLKLQRQFVREINASSKTPWTEYITRRFWSKILDLNVTRVLPAKSVAFASPRRDRVSEEEFKGISQGASNAMNNMIGVALIVSGSAEDGVKFLEQCSDYGKSNYNLGVAHETGDASGKPDLEKAFSYYKKGAELGNKNATFNMAIYYLTGKGSIEKNIDRGRQLLEKASEMGVPEAANYIKLLQDSQITSRQLLTTNSGLQSSSSAPNISSWVPEVNRSFRGPCCDLYKDDGAISFGIAIK